MDQHSLPDFRSFAILTFVKNDLGSLSNSQRRLLQGVMESEIKFYARLLPELASVGARMPTTHSFLWGDYKNSGKEVLLLENLTGKGFKHPPEFDFDKGYFKITSKIIRIIIK